MEEKEIQPSLFTLYRELGQIEGRVTALEDTMREVKGLLTGISSQLGTIQSTVSTALGRREGSEKAFGVIGAVLTIVISGITAFITVHYGH